MRKQRHNVKAEKYLFCGMAILFLACGSLQAQYAADSVVRTVQSIKTGVIRGTVMSHEDGERLGGAYIYLGSKHVAVMAADTNGRFVLEQLPVGEHLLSVSHTGYQLWSKRVLVKDTLELGEIRMVPVVLEEAVVESSIPFMVMKGDTMQYNIAAVHIAEDAYLEDLIKKLPGFAIVNGKLMVNGEEVKKLYVDGMDYFSGDPLAVLKVLPARLIERIKMFDDRSEEAKFSGYDDGSKLRTLNLETKNPDQMKMFGRLTFGYGVPEVKKKNMQADVSFSFFDRNRKISVQGDLDQLTPEHLPAARYAREAGRNISRGGSGNISTKLGKKGDMSANYSIRKSGNYGGSLSRQEYLPTEQYESRVYDRESHSRSDNLAHYMHVNGDYSFSRKNKFRWSAMMNISRREQSGLSWNDNIENGDTVNCTDMRNRSVGKDHSAGGDLTWMHAFKKQGRTFIIKGGGRYRQSVSDDFRNVWERLRGGSRQGLRDTLRNQKNRDKQTSYSIDGNVTYSEPLSKFSRVSANYRYSWSRDESSRNSLAYRDQEFEKLIGIDTALTNRLINTYSRHRMGINYNYYKKKITFNGGVNVSWDRRENRYYFLGNVDSVGMSDYLDYSPRMDFSYQLQKRKRLSVRYYGNTNSPAASQLQDVLDVTNPLQVSRGNPGLKKSYMHHLSVNYSMMLKKEGQNCSFHLLAGQTMNQMAMNVKYMQRDTLIEGYLISQGATLTYPVNLNGNWNTDVRMNGTFEWKKTRWNVSMNYGYNHSPSIYDDRRNISKRHDGGIDVGFYTDISDYFDFSWQYSVSYSNTKNSSTGRGQNLDQRTSAGVRWMFWKGLQVNGNYAFSYYWNHTHTTTRQANHMLNLGVSKKFGKQKRAELRLEAKDIFRERNRVDYTVTDLYSQMSYHTVFENYYTLSFTYRFEHLGKDK